MWKAFVVEGAGRTEKASGWIHGTILMLCINFCWMMMNNASLSNLALIPHHSHRSIIPSPPAPHPPPPPPSYPPSPTLLKERPRAHDLPPPPPPHPTCPTSILTIASHIPILMDVPGLTRAHSFSLVPRPAFCLLLFLFPLALPFAFALHLALEQGSGGPSAGFGLGLGL